MNRSVLTRPLSLRAGLLLPMGLLALFGTTLVRSISRPAALAAAEGERMHDVDADGLPDAQERVVGTKPREADSDGDGFCDAEEFARRSSPRAANSTPEPRAIDVGISGHARDGRLHVLVMVYAADGTLKGKNMTLLAATGEQVFELTGKVLARRATIESRPARAPGARIFAIDFEIQPKFVYTVGELSFSASVSAPETGEEGVAAVLDLAAIDETICVRFRDLDLGLRHTPDPGTANSSATSSGSNTSSTKMGGVYVPIYAPDRARTTPPPDDPPASSNPGQVCVQETVQVGVSGGTIVSEVVSAECVDGWDGYCGSMCSAQVGSLVRSIDPVVFAGG